MSADNDSQIHDDHKSPPLYYERRELNHDAGEQRFIVLYPCSGDKNAPFNPVRCRIEQHPMNEIQDFVAVKNSRGYRLLNNEIYVDDEIMLVPVAVEAFLRHFRKETEPVTLWIRHICLNEFGEKQYFNRAFLDSMYAQASRVVDMSEYNQSLLDSGSTIAGYQDGCRTAKDWTNRPQYKIPQIYPFKLGQQLSETAPRDYHVYVPLDPIVGEIRVLVIQQAEDWSAPIIARLAHLPLYSDQGYEALSYTWGDPEPTVDIVVTGQKMTIRKSLDTMLRTVRRPDNFIAIWIDAICIDQNNPRERERQVPRMAEIYSRAVHVICYVGPADDDTDEVLDFAREMEHIIGGMKFDDKTQTWDIERNPKVGSSRFPRLCAGLYRLLTRPYFRRVWVIQEVANASNPSLGIGTHMDGTMDMLQRGLSHLNYLMVNDERLVDKMRDADPNLSLMSRDELRYARTMFYFRHMISQGRCEPTWIVSFMGKDEFGITDETPHFLEALLFARDFKSSVAHDKIFGLWSLAWDRDGLDLKPDYSKSAHDVFTDFTKAWAIQHNSLDIISAAEPASLSSMAGDSPGRTSAPSWAPDWATPSQVSCLARRDKVEMGLLMGGPQMVQNLDGVLYNADGRGKKGRNLASSSWKMSNPLFEFRDDLLHAKGIILDGIAGWYTREDDEDEDEYRIGTSKRSTRDQEIVACAADMYSTSSSLPSPYSDPEQAAIAMVHGDSASAWRVTTTTLSKAEPDSTAGKAYLPDLPSTRHIGGLGGRAPNSGGFHRAQSADIRASVTRGRILASTARRRWMCMIPEWIVDVVQDPRRRRPPMIYVALLAGCSVPVLLLEDDDEDAGTTATATTSDATTGTTTDDGGSKGEDTSTASSTEKTFRGTFLGSVFVQGIMDGEEAGGIVWQEEQEDNEGDNEESNRGREGEGDDKEAKKEARPLINIILR